MKKKIITVLLIFAATACLAACGTADRPLNWEDETMQVALGDRVVLSVEDVFDAHGNVYTVSASVKDVDGKNVDVIANEFLVTDKRGYKIIYSAVRNGGKATERTVTVQVTDSDRLTVWFESEDFRMDSGKSFTIPEISVVGAAAETTTSRIEFYKVESDSKTLVAFEGDTVFVEDTGTYELVATVTDGTGKSGECNLYVYVAEPPKAGEIENFDEESSLLDVRWISDSTTKTWLKEFEGRSGVMMLDSQYLWPGFNVSPRLPREAYEQYDYITISMYIDDPFETLKFIRFLDNSGVSEYFEFSDLKRGAWADYSVSSNLFLKYYDRFADFHETGAGAGGRIWGETSDTSGVKIYVDRIFAGNYSDTRTSEICAGEIEFFDDAGVLNSMKGTMGAYSYLDEFNGATGVVKVSLMPTADWYVDPDSSHGSNNAWKIYFQPRGDKSAYENYTKIGFRIWIEGDLVYDIKLFDDATDTYDFNPSKDGSLGLGGPRDAMKKGEWLEFEFDIAYFLENFDWFAEGKAYLLGNAFGSMSSIYIDAIYAC